MELFIKANKISFKVREFRSSQMTCSKGRKKCFNLWSHIFINKDKIFFRLKKNYKNTLQGF